MKVKWIPFIGNLLNPCLQSGKGERGRGEEGGGGREGREGECDNACSLLQCGSTF